MRGAVRDICPPADIESNARWRALLARVESLEGRHDDAVRLAAEAVEWESRGDQVDAIGDRYVDQATVLAAAGRVEQAREAADHAVDYYRRKENVASGRRAAALRALALTTPPGSDGIAGRRGLSSRELMTHGARLSDAYYLSPSVLVVEGGVTTTLTPSKATPMHTEPTTKEKRRDTGRLDNRVEVWGALAPIGATTTVLACLAIGLPAAQAATRADGRSRVRRLGVLRHPRAADGPDRARRRPDGEDGERQPSQRHQAR